MVKFWFSLPITDIKIKKKNHCVQNSYAHVSAGEKYAGCRICFNYQLAGESKVNFGH